MRMSGPEVGDALSGQRAGLDVEDVAASSASDLMYARSVPLCVGISLVGIGMSGGIGGITIGTMPKTRVLRQYDVEPRDLRHGRDSA